MRFALAQRTSRIKAQPSWSGLFSLPENGEPVNQTAAELSAGGSRVRKYSARLFVFSSFFSKLINSINFNFTLLLNISL